MKNLLHPSYFPSISHCVAMAQSDKIVFEMEDNFQKQTNRNRTYIYSPNGIQLLNIPVKHSKTAHQKTKDVLIDAIMNERFKELPFEGHRFWDAKRRNLPINRLAADARTAASTTLPAGNFRFILPIPNSEILANPKIQQNPGYTN